MGNLEALPHLEAVFLLSWSWGLLSWSWSWSWPSLSRSWSCPYCLGLVPRDQDRSCWKVPATYWLTRNPVGKVLDNDQSWGLWPRWIAILLYPPTIPQYVAVALFSRLWCVPVTSAPALVERIYSSPGSVTDNDTEYRGISKYRYRSRYFKYRKIPKKIGKSVFQFCKYNP